MGVSCGDVDSCQDDPEYKVMKCLVFGTILSSLLSELQIIIPKTDRNCVWSGMVNMQGGGVRFVSQWQGYVVVLVLGDLVTRSHSVRCSSIQVPELSDSDSYSGSPQPFITRFPEDL